MKTIFKLITIVLVVLYQSQCVVDRTYFIYLGLPITATSSDIERAYQEKKTKIQALQDGQPKQQKSKLLEEAYKTLISEDKRNAYERLTKDIFKKDKAIQDLKKLTKETRKGKKFKLTLPVSVEDVYHGKTISTYYLKDVACDQCRGTGAESPKFLKSCSKCAGNGFGIKEMVNGWGQKVVLENTCPSCLGWGKQSTKTCSKCGGARIIKRIQNVQITIPKGGIDGNKIEVKNFGDEPVVGAPSDLEIEIVEIPTKQWKRQGHNLVRTVELTFEESIFGFKKQFLHLNGEKIKIERQEATTKETRITFDGKGIENKANGKKGQLVVKFRIVMPIFTDEQLDMWQQFFSKYKL